MLGFDTISFASSSSIQKYRPNSIRGLLVSTSANNNVRLAAAINNISLKVAPGANEGGDFSIAVDNAAELTHILPKGKNLRRAILSR